MDLYFNGFLHQLNRHILFFEELDFLGVRNPAFFNFVTYFARAGI
jgi:hypothetical protein